MERLVMCFTVGDGCTYSCSETIPFKYESSEAALVDFEELIKRSEFESEVTFAGQTFSPSDFFENGVFYGPNIYTIDEWFAAEGVE